MAERLIESATLTLVGVVVVFITLVVLMFAIILLTKTTPTREEHKEEIREPAPEVLPSQVEPGVSDKEAVAAMAVALAQMVEESETVSAGQQPQLVPSGPEAKSSPWAVSGRDGLMRSREKAGRQWEGLSR